MQSIPASSPGPPGIWTRERASLRIRGISSRTVPPDRVPLENPRQWPAICSYCRPTPEKKKPAGLVVVLPSPRQLLLKRLDPVFHAGTEVRRRWFGLGAMGGSLICGLLLWAWVSRREDPPAGLGLAWLAAAAGLIWAARRLAGRWPDDLLTMARRIEARFPELQGRLLTVLELPDPPRGKAPGYLEERLLRETLTHSTEQDWTLVTRRPTRGAGRCCREPSGWRCVPSACICSRSIPRCGWPRPRRPPLPSWPSR